jgi:hypothetical protein
MDEIGELSKIAVFAETVGVEILGITTTPEGSLTCELVGKHLAYQLVLSSSGLALSGMSADLQDANSLVVHKIQPSDWKVIARIISALEFAEVESVAQRPIQLTDRFGEGWVID